MSIKMSVKMSMKMSYQNVNKIVNRNVNRNVNKNVNKNASQNVSREPSFRYTTILQKKTIRKCDILDPNHKEMRYNHIMNVNENAGNPILDTQRDQIISKPTQNTPTYRKIEKSRKTECREFPGVFLQKTLAGQAKLLVFFNFYRKT